MKWYLLAQPELAAELKERKVIFSLKEINTPISTKGVCFPETEKEKVMSLVEKSELVFEEVITNLSNVYLLQKVDPFEVKIERNESTEKTRPILEEYARAFKRRIHLHSTHGVSFEPINNEWLHIYPYAAPVVDGTRKMTMLFGIKLPNNGTNDSVKFDIESSGGIAMKDPDGVHYGEICGTANNNLYIYFDITHSWSSTHEMILRKILDQYFLMTGNPEEFAKIKEEIRKQKEEEEHRKAIKARDNYIKACSQRLKETIEKIGKDIKSEEERIKKLSSDLALACKRHEDLKLSYEQVLKDKDILLEQFGQEYDHLLDHGMVEKVYVYDGEVEIWTKELELNSHKIGKFKVTMHIGDGRFACTNISRIIGGKNHPHVNDNPYDCCFGSSKDEIQRLIKKYQFAVAFHKIWGRLNRYDKNNPYLKIENWPKKEEEDE